MWKSALREVSNHNHVKTRSLSNWKFKEKQQSTPTPTTSTTAISTTSNWLKGKSPNKVQSSPQQINSRMSVFRFQSKPQKSRWKLLKSKRFMRRRKRRNWAGSTKWVTTTSWPSNNNRMIPLSQRSSQKSWGCWIALLSWTHLQSSKTMNTKEATRLSIPISGSKPVVKQGEWSGYRQQRIKRSTITFPTHSTCQFSLRKSLLSMKSMPTKKNKNWLKKESRNPTTTQRHT